MAVGDRATATRIRSATPASVSLKSRWSTRQAGRGKETQRVYRSAQCPKCEGQTLELEGELVSDEGVPVTLAEGEEVIMTYRTSDGTARAGEDYAKTTGTLTFTVREPSPLIRVTTLEDELNESDEFFTVTLLPAELPDRSRTDRLDSTLTIFDNDGLTATLSAEQTILEEGEPARFRVELSGGVSTAPVVVEYVVAGSSTVTAGEDYEEPSGRMTIAAGAAGGVFTIVTLDDELIERDEWMAVQLPEECCASAGSVKPGAAAEPVRVTDNDVIEVSIGEATAGGATARAGEGEPVRFVVRLSAAVPEEIAVSYRTANETGAGAATSGRDYNATEGTLRFAPEAALAQTIEVATRQDELNEGTETFTVTLSGRDLPDWVRLAPEERSATGAIEDDDELTARVSAVATNVAEGDPAGFTVELSGGLSTAPVVVAYSVAGTTTEGSDYLAAPGSLTIGAGNTRSTVTVATRLDGEREPEETLEVRLDAARTVGAARVEPTPAGVTIVDVDSRSITIADAEGAEGDGKLEFEVRLLAPSSLAVAVSYATEDGTAKAGEDYQAAAGTVTVAAGAGSATITVRVVDDSLDEADRETFTIRLSDPVAGKLATGSMAVGSIRDDDNPPGISIADAGAKESAGEITFPVTLERRSGLPVVVSYRTEDGTAKAGEDYQATVGALTIAAGQTRGTIGVDVIHDTVKEPDETFRIRLTAAGESTGAPSATGTILDDDEAVEQVWLARFGRTVAIHVVDVVGDRATGGGVSSSQATLAGRRLQPVSVATTRQRGGAELPFRALDGYELVAGSSFHLAAMPGDEESTGGAGTWAGWGRGSVTRLTGEEVKAELSLKGTVVTATVGVDYDWGPVLTGLALSYSGAGADFGSAAQQLHPRNGTAGSWLVSAHPYARVTVLEGLELWGSVGYGLGGMTLVEDASVDRAIRMMMAGLGLRGTLLTPAVSEGFGVVVVSDGLVLRANAEAAGGQPEVEADAIRGRLLAEGSYDAQLGDGSVLTPVVEVGVRYDGGHAEEGLGAELGGGVRYHQPEWGLTTTARGGFVLVHQEQRFQEWSLRGAVRLSSDPAGRGLALDIDSSWGTAAVGVQHLGEASEPALLELLEASAVAGRMDAKLGYGFGVNVLGGDVLLVPYVGVTVAGEGQTYRVGGRANFGSSFSVSLQGERRTGPEVAPAHGVSLRGSVRW
ncbi:MAG: hypothetical protein OXQ31_01210 [Spirochaetaceae bacterium]|nr:hypothetical protein [Spirochaetaceae bacterium]